MRMVTMGRRWRGARVLAYSDGLRKNSQGAKKPRFSVKRFKVTRFTATRFTAISFTVTGFTVTSFTDCVLLILNPESPSQNPPGR
jgi:hypothetical protein